MPVVDEYLVEAGIHGAFDIGFYIIPNHNAVFLQGFGLAESIFKNGVIGFQAIAAFGGDYFGKETFQAGMLQLAILRGMETIGD